MVSYTLLIKKQANKALQSVPQPDRTRITEKIVLLGKNPDNASLDIKKLGSTGIPGIQRSINKAGSRTSHGTSGVLYLDISREFR